MISPSDSCHRFHIAASQAPSMISFKCLEDMDKPSYTVHHIYTAQHSLGFPKKPHWPK